MEYSTERIGLFGQEGGGVKRIVKLYTGIYIYILIGLEKIEIPEYCQSVLKEPRKSMLLILCAVVLRRVAYKNQRENKKYKLLIKTW